MAGPLWVTVAALLTTLAVWLRALPVGGVSTWFPLRFPERLVRRVRRLVARHEDPPVAQLLVALVAELRAGQPTRDALDLACAGLTPPPCPAGRQAAIVGGDIPAALRRDARDTGGRSLWGLAACWEVAEHSGAGLADAVDRLAEGHRAGQRAAEQLDAEVAAARASARILALLPLFGLLVGHWMGADPLEWLVGTWPGRGALAVGGLLQVLGLVWLNRLTAGVRARLGP
jgi:tight adherence protein B